MHFIASILIFLYLFFFVFLEELAMNITRLTIVEIKLKTSENGT